MPQRPPGEGRRSAPQNKLLLAFAFILIPWLQLADAQQQQRQPSAALPPHGQHDLKNRHVDSDPDQPIVPRWAATSVDGVDDSRETIASGQREHEPIVYDKGPQQIVHEQVIWGSDASARKQQQQQRQQKRDRQLYDPISNPSNNKPAPLDASALATFALAPKSVRASDPSRHLGSGSRSSAGGLASPQLARSLGDWEVEDFVLLATVDGDLYATDRKTGQQRWHLEVDQPMIETHHYRANSSVLDEDFKPVDHYIWAVEPTTHGGLYLWNPTATSPVRTGFTMKKLVEELAPYANNDIPVIYTGDKKTTLITLDAATGRVLKWFGSGGSHVNEDARESCLQSNALYDTRNEECSTGSAGTITLGRTEYTVEIHRSDGRRVATLKYSEWGPNHFDNDLYDQYHESIDDRYITSEHNGKVYAFDYFRSGKVRPVFTHQLAGPVARVFDICRPGDAPTDSNPGLVVLPQPPMPSQDADDENMRGNSIFLNHTESGNWYALSGNAYPLIIKAPIAQISRPDWGLLKPHWDTINESKLSKALVGTHILGAGYSQQQQTLPPGTKPNVYEELPEHQSTVGSLTPAPEETPTIMTTFKAINKSAADSFKDFISNPILIILFVGALIYHEKKIRRGYHHFRRTGSIKETMLYFTSDSTEAFQHDSSASGAENEMVKPEPKPAVAEDAATAEKHSEPQASDDLDGAKPVARTEPQTAADTTVLRAADQDKPAPDDQTPVAQASDAQNGDSAGAPAESAPEKKKKAHRGRRGGVKHRKGRAREASQSREDEATPTTVDEAVNNAKKLGDRPSLEPDVMTVANDVQAVSGPIIRLGNIEVNMDDQLGTGSNGTLVFAGKYDDREVAVKRMLIQFYDIASQETKLLRESDDHPNVIRYYAQQQRDGFLYIALERCAASLADVVEKPHVFRELANAGKMDLPGVLYQITNGISHLHELRIVHRDLKPQNILVNMGKDGKPRLLVSDFGLCKKLEGGQSSFGATTGRAAGTSGWRAPELLLDDDARDAGVVDISTHSGSGSVLVNDHLSPNGRRATRAIDIFSLGLVFFYVLTNGSHPFDCGDRYMREVNIRKNNYNLRPLDALGDFAYEAEDLIESMLQADAKQRPNAKDVMSHPFFWSAKKRLAFLCDVSDHFEKEPRDPPSAALMELERHAAKVTKGDFLRQLPREFVDSLGKQRKYTGSKMLDLLRALRNKRNHYEDMPDSLKRTVGPLPDGYLAFWTVRFPMLLLVCWNVVYNVQWEETDRFREYYIPAGL